MEFDPERITFFAKTDARGQHTPFGIKAKDRTRHVYVIGKTGMGKSTLLENMAVQDIKNGEGLAFIDPHGATAETLLDYIPEERKDDVLYFAPFDSENPVAFNVMEDVGPDKRHLVVSGLMSVFKKIWVDAWSARMEYILQNTLLALLEYPDSTLLGVNRMLSEKHFRRKVIDNISDPAVKSFWVDEFLNYNERYMQEAGDAIKNKIGQFTANPLIRNIIGQPKSSFDIREMMDQRKILIMNLSKGLVGESNANLLGSMLTTRIYLAAMSRADMSQQEMKTAPNFYFYVDEFQSFANATFADILSEARKYKLNLTIAHQYIEQMEEEVKNAVFGNVGTIISFRVGPFDAEVLETIYAPQFYAVDICNLGFAQIYLTLMIDGIGSQPFSATTLPPIEHQGISCKDMVVHASRTRFGRPRATIEKEIMGWHEEEHGPSGGNRGGPKNGHQGGPKGGGKKSAPPTSNGKPPARQSRGADTRPAMSPNKKVPSNGQRKDKSLMELRSVLAGLTGDEVKKDEPKKLKKNSVQTTAPSKDVKPRPEVSAVLAKKTDSTKNTDIVPKGTPATTLGDDPAAALKTAVAKALAGTGTNRSSAARPEKKPTKTSASAECSRKPVEDQAEKKTTSAKPADAPAPTQPKESAQQLAHRETDTERPKRAPETTSTSVAVTDPLDPKKLERMMRVTTSDKTPLK